MEFISPNLRLEFRELCVTQLVLRQIDDVFRMAGVEIGTVPENLNINGQRRYQVESYYASIDWIDSEDAQKFLTVLSLAISQSYISDDLQSNLRKLCTDEGLIVEGNQIRFPKSVSEEDIDLFAKQFPVGLPFGIKKPDFAITAKEGRQSVMFELKSGIGIIWQNVYPNLDFQSFQSASGITPSTNLALKNALIAMNQTKHEKDFFLKYARHFKMADNFVPMLIPQAWIQWHSLTKKALRASKRPLADELYRVDFVAFWGNQRYAILIDDISHYGVKNGSKWLADEESYSKRLDEDRKLQAEGWRIFRISNWEIRQNRVEEILIDLQRLIGFD